MEISEKKKAVKIIRDAFKRYKYKGYSKCYICRESLCIKSGFDNICQVIAASGKLGLYAHNECRKKTIECNKICPYCNGEVLDKYHNIQSIWGNIKKHPMFIYEKTNFGLQKWHSDCHRAITYGFQKKQQLNKTQKIDKTWRGYCLVCDEPIFKKQCRYQVTGAKSGEYGTYIHDKCYSKWINPRFHFYKIYSE